MTPEPSEGPSTAERSLAIDAALTRRATLAGWSVSALVHVVTLALVYVVGEVPDYGFEFSAPAELELGMTDAVEVEAIPAVAPPPTAVEPSPLASARGEGAMDAGVPAHDGAIAEAGVPSDAPRRRRPDAAVTPDAPELLATAESTQSDDTRPPVAFLPAGGQIALRIDLERVRSSTLRADVESLLAAIPDWQAILGSSGVDPVRDLSRVLLATPNLRRSSVVIAGRLAEGADSPDAIVERMITNAGGAVTWQDVAGARSADWPNPDATPRRVAVIGDRHFVIARGEDLPRVLAIAAARAERAHEEAPTSDTVSPADALLALPDGAALTIEVEGARAYVRQSPCTLPTRLSARIDEVESGLEVSVHGIFDDATQSADSAACLEHIRAQALGTTLIALWGMSSALGGLEIEPHDAMLDAHTRLSFGQAQRLLRTLRDSFPASEPEPPPSTVTPVPPPTAIAPVPPPPVPPPVPPPTTAQ